MPLKIVRNDITKMNTEAIVNTSNDHSAVGAGCDSAVYKAAGYEELLKYREEKIGFVPEGEVFITPGFHLQAKYIIHAVSPRYNDGKQGEEEKLRACYRKSLQLAKKYGLQSIAFPLISTGGFGYPKEEGMRIAVDEINAFLLGNNMLIYLVVFDRKSTMLGEKLFPDLESYIDRHYVERKQEEEYIAAFFDRGIKIREPNVEKPPVSAKHVFGSVEEAVYDFSEKHESRLEERMTHLSDTFSQYLMYLIREKKMENAEVWRRAIVDRKIFSKIKNNPNYHPQKLTALCLCVGAKLNLDESKDLLARAGYALSPCDKTDIIFSYFIENEIYDMIELDIQLEEHGLPC
ncbi:MAG: macro domain-containing protein, partial [Lachnospiraceae bacterium]|nr:macro domain-containing protein [Lachnospiraceae bacterium]